MNKKKLFMSLAIFSSTFIANEFANVNEAEASTKYKLTNTTKTYVNATSAKTGTNPAKKTYAAGNYYVYKTASNGMINISMQQGKAGAWINPNQKLTTTQAKAQVAQKTAAQPKTTQTSQQVAKTTPTNTQGAKTYTLKNSVNVYNNAANAQAGAPSQKTYTAGNYYIYKTASNGMINISRQQGKAGAWINPLLTTKVKSTTAADRKPVTQATSEKVASTKSLAKKSNSTYKLERTTPVYTNASNANVRKDSKFSYEAGNYYVYKIASNGMINISKQAGKVGAWINPNAKSTATVSKTEKKVSVKPKSQTVAQSIVTQDKGSNSGVRNNYGKYSKVIYLDAGHGGTDPGAVYNGLKEKDLTLSIYNKLSSQLKKEGYTIMATRTGDTKATLTEISERANKTNADLFVSIHFNASTSSSAKGIETYWYQDYEEYPSKINKDNHVNPDRLRRSQILAEGIHSNLVKNTGASDRGVRRDTYSVLRETAIPAVLLELGYVSNKDEAYWLGKSTYQDKLVDGIVSGINNYYKKA